jgi:ABC-type sugar transport system substrate-binding protein
MHKVIVILLSVLAGLCALSCNRDNEKSGGGKKPVIGVSFDTLQTEYWVASRDAITAEVAARGGEVLEAVANNDANRQLEQVNNFIAKGVDGIIIAPKDAQSVVPIVRAANKAGIPIVLYNRPPGEGAGKCVTVVADNVEITRKTVTYMCEQAKAGGGGKKYKALILVGDLADANAIARRDGFDEAVKPYADVIQVVSRVPTEWNQEKALAGLTNALQANPDINFLFTSSDFMLPQLQQVLETFDKWHKRGEEGNVVFGGFDGDANAYALLADGYLDACGVQNLFLEVDMAFKAFEDMWAGKKPEKLLLDPGFVIETLNI